MPGSKAAQSQTSMRASDFEHSGQNQLDEILTDLCELVIQGQYKNQDLGMVAAAVLDPDLNCVVGINYPTRSGRRVHAERAAIDSYTARFGPVPPGSTVITTLNPCSHDMAEREGSSCTDLVKQHGIRKVYCGCVDPEQVADDQAFDLEVTGNPKIQALCKAFANTFLKDKLNEDANNTAISLTKLPKYHKGGVDELAKYVPERSTHTFALDPNKWQGTFYSLTNKDLHKLKYYGPKKVEIVPGTLVGDMAIANQFYRATDPSKREHFAQAYKESLKPYTGDVSGYRFPELLIPATLTELSFLGSPCTKDCSGHRAGYAWSKARGGVDANSPFSPSFNNGARLARDGK
jgi:pyrimidine deaminase RibD-like protein